MSTLGRKVAAVGLVGNMALIGGILYRRQEHLDEEQTARVKWEAARQDNELDCFFAAKQYYDQCSFQPDDDKECTRLGGVLEDCKKRLSASLPPVLPAMRPDLLGYKH